MKEARIDRSLCWTEGFLAISIMKKLNVEAVVSCPPCISTHRSVKRAFSDG
jgi:hypothetical protein